MKKSRFNHGETSQNSERRFGNNSSNLNDSKNAPNNGRRFGNNSSNQNQQNGNRDNENKMSADEKFKLVNETLTAVSKAFESGFNYGKEKQNTKRVKIEQVENIKKLNNENEKVLSGERIKIAEIESEYKLNYKTLENENEQNKLNTMVILKVLDIVDNLTNRINENERKYSFDHPEVIDLSNKLHEQSINLTNLLNLNN